MKTNKANLRQRDILGNAGCSSEREIFAETVKQWSQKLGYCSIFAAVPVMLASHVTGERSDEPKKTEASVAGQSSRHIERLNLRASNPTLLKRQSEFVLPHQKGSLDTWTTLAGNDDCTGRAIPEGNYTAASPYIDSGDTTGANNTVTSVGVNGYYCYFYSYDFHGPDHIYSFTLTGRGANAQIQISATSGTYEPAAYILDSRVGGCSRGNDRCSLITMSGSTPGGTATINSVQVGFLPLNVRLYLFVDSLRAGASGSGPYTIRIQDVTIADASSPNPIELADFFVRQHYSDFLNRGADADGLAYWTNEITQCGSDAACIHRRRIGVSAAFFVEQEFQETSYHIYRLYKASFDRAPNYTEFTEDRSRVGPNLEPSKQGFAEGWVQRPAFVASYPTTMSNTEFVNKLFNSAGLTASRYDALRQQEILAMNTGRSRALVLRDVIEIPDFRNFPDPNDPRYSELKQVSQYNPAFVLLQYFDYLRRNADPAGYDFWLDVVNNREPNNYRGMVCAFLTSTEYQLRFGSVAPRSNADCAQ